MNWKGFGRRNYALIKAKLSRNLPGKSKENHGQSVSQPRLPNASLKPCRYTNILGIYYIM
jgi:hypothetical protein